MLSKHVLGFVAYVMDVVLWIAFGPTERNIIKQLFKLKELDSSCPEPAMFLANSVINVTLKFVFVCDGCPENFFLGGNCCRARTLNFPVHGPYINLLEA